MWQEIAESIGHDVMVSKRNKDKITVRIHTIPSVMRKWIMSNLSRCEVIGSKHFRDEIQMEIMEAYRKYCN